MCYSTYKLLHFLGIFMVFTALGGWCVHAANGGRRAEDRAGPWLKFLHFVGFALTVLGGFGMQAKVTELGWPGWLLAKIGIWVLLGASMFVPDRWPRAARPLLGVFPLLGFLAVWLVLYRPLS